MYNTIDPNQGTSLTYLDVVNINEWAYGEMQQLHLAGQDTSGTGLPLTDPQRRRKKETEDREKEAKKAANQINYVGGRAGKGDQKGGQRPDIGPAAGKGAGGDKTKSISTTTSTWAVPCKFWDGPKGECTKGINCLFKHTGFRMFDDRGMIVKRRVACGSPDHTNKECKRPGGAADPNRDQNWAAYKERRAQQPAPAGAGGDKGGRKGQEAKGQTSFPRKPVCSDCHDNHSFTSSIQCRAEGNYIS